MHSRPFQPVRLAPAPGFSTASVYRALLCTLGILYGALVLAFFYQPAWDAHWLEGILLLLSTVVILMNAMRHLPAQNVIGTAVLVALVGGAAHSLGAATGIPFGPFRYTDDLGPRLFGVIAWPMPFIWVLFVFTSRGVTRLILRPWRRTRNYGFMLIGITCALVVLLDVGLEVFATQANTHWKWSDTKLHFNIFGAPVVNYFAWALVSLLILAFVSPLLINKKPGSAPAPDYHPLVVWLLINAFFGAGAASKNLTPEALSIMSFAICIAALAAIGAWWWPHPQPSKS